MRENVLGKRIAKVLDTRRMTQTDLAKQVGVTEATITRYVHGSRFPNSKILARIAAALNVSADYLIGLEDKMSKKRTGNKRQQSTVPRRGLYQKAP